MKKIIYISLLLIPLKGYNQSYDIKYLLARADSVMLETIGTKYAGYYQYDSSSYYEYYGLFGKEKKLKLNQGLKTKGKFSEASIQYKLNYPSIEELKSTFYVEIFIIRDSLKIWGITNDVPDFISENRVCDFITQKQAMDISIPLIKEKGLYIEYSLYRDFDAKKFIWEIRNIINESTNGRFMDGLMELIWLNPISGEVLEQDLIHFGQVF